MAKAMMKYGARFVWYIQVNAVFFYLHAAELDELLALLRVDILIRKRNGANCDKKR